ncbi:hypothetical protein B0T26DRAFT_677060 [Lasiosphaeria miniovina]|uniref:NACHT domain-containing protein n=1 Tax=Lasiosphaeria miniovina TaxID=1954250 RepID=A0AA40AB32_9PEZI|nr:uncharacterized protein B0T26DRAFT_677060 [Lasiosphaeria miniovina]KAK0712619.1 hypothetical protein B0T26DRAFT_677060 [Lasiosphaeria miniovina]
MLVEHTSATHAGPNEKNYDQLSIDADHSEIVKFDNPSNPYYVVVAERVRKLVALGPEIIANRLAEHRRRLSEKEREYIRLLQALDYAAFRKYKIADPAPNTLGWFLEKPEFASWKQSEASSLLWIQGSAGQGKTILAKFLLDHLETAFAKANGTTVIYFFFYEQDGSLRTIGSALRALIRQLLSARDVETFRTTSEKVDLDGSQINEVFCVIDGLDEFPDISQREDLIKFLRRLTASSGAKSPPSPILKTLMVSRPTVDLDRQLQKCTTIGLAANPHDLQAFVHHELAFLRDQRDDEQHTTAVDMLIGRSGQTFLWISLVVRRLKAAAMLTTAEIGVIISESPSQLGKFYDSIVTDIMQQDGNIPKKLLLWAVYWQRPLTLVELEEAISVQHESASIESTLEHRLPLRKNRNSLSGAIGVIVNISDDNQVHLAHQSVKEFLVSSSHLASAEFCRGLQPNLYLAKVCMLFLCFPDSEADPANDGRLGFLRYAAWNWHRHIESDPDSGIGSLGELIARVTAPRSQVLRRWARVAGLLAGLENAKGPWDIAMAANIDWLCKSKIDVPDKGVDVAQVVDAAGRGPQGYALLLTLVRRASVIFTDDAVCEMVRRFDQPMVRYYYDSHWDLPKTQALYLAALDNKEPVPILRYLLEMSKGNEDRKLTRLVVDASFSSSLIRYYNDPRLYRNNPDFEYILPDFEYMVEVQQSASDKLSEVLRVLVRSEAVEFDPEAEEHGGMVMLYYGEKSPEMERWKKTLNNRCVLWLLLVTGIGNKISVSDRVFQEANSRQSAGVANVLRQIQVEDTETEYRHLSNLLEPPLSSWKREVLQDANTISSRTGDRDIRLTDEFGIRAALYKEVEVLAIVFEHWPDALRITKDFLRAAVATYCLNQFPPNPWRTPPTADDKDNDYTENDRAASEEWALQLMNLLLRSRRCDVESAICDEVCLTDASSGNRRILRPLYEEERLVSLKTEWSLTADLRRTVVSGYNAESLEPLLQHQTLLDTADYWGSSPLMMAVRHRKTEMVRMLLESGAVDVNKANKQGRTPLFCACNNHFDYEVASAKLSIVIMLLRAGAQPDIVDNHGNTLLGWARKQKVFQMEGIIKEVKEAQKQGLELEALFDKMLDRAKGYNGDDSSLWDSMIERPQPTTPSLDESNDNHKIENGATLSDVQTEDEHLRKVSDSYEREMRALLDFRGVEHLSDQGESKQSIVVGFTSGHLIRSTL